MKKLAILLLTIFTIGTATACGCGSSKLNDSYDNKIKTESLNIQEIETEQDKQDEQEEHDEHCKPEHRGRKHRDGKLPAPRKPRRRHMNRMPNPKFAFRK